MKHYALSGLIAAALSITSSFAFSEDSGSSSGSSTSARKDKTAGVSGHLGYLVSAISGIGIDGFYNKGPDWQIGLYAASAHRDLKDEVSNTTYARVDKLEVDARVFAAQARYFVGNSFNIYGQVGQRVIDWKIKVSSTISNDSIESKGSATSMFAGIGIGNTWSWDNGFFIGGDWIGYFAPFGSSSKTSNTVTGSVTSDLDKINKDTEDLGKTLGKVGHVHLAVLNIGCMF